MGLKGQGIPLEFRILAIVDADDAMVRAEIQLDQAVVPVDN